MSMYSIVKYYFVFNQQIFVTIIIIIIMITYVIKFIFKLVENENYVY